MTVCFPSRAPKKQGQLYKAQDTHTGNLLEVMHGTRGSRGGRSPICIFPHWPSAEAATRRGTTLRACHVSHLSYMMYNLMHCILSRASRSQCGAWTWLRDVAWSKCHCTACHLLEAKIQSNFFVFGHSLIEEHKPTRKMVFVWFPTWCIKLSGRGLCGTGAGQPACLVIWASTRLGAEQSTVCSL